jgi:peptide/nickel transport system ATP-binding protein
MLAPPRTLTNPLLSLQNIEMHFPIRSSLFRTELARVVDSVSLSINRGETLALVGESGSGKTTLGRLTLRILTPTSGRIKFDGHDITNSKENELRWFRKRAQAIFQDPYSSLDPFMNVFQILDEPLKIHDINEKSRKEIVFRALREVRLDPEEYASKYPHTLSGGQRQRVNIARALILQPDYIVADEPVSMIDVSSRVEILELLQDFQVCYGLTILYITHDIATAKYFANRIAVMYLGRIVELGFAEDVVKEPLHPYTMTLIDTIPEADPSNRFKYRSSIEGEQPSPTSIPVACRFHPRCKFFMPRKCDVIDPLLIEVKKEHYVACHLHPKSNNDS